MESDPVNKRHNCISDDVFHALRKAHVARKSSADLRSRYVPVTLRLSSKYYCMLN